MPYYASLEFTRCGSVTKQTNIEPYKQHVVIMSNYMLETSAVCQIKIIKLKMKFTLRMLK